MLYVNRVELTSRFVPRKGQRFDASRDCSKLTETLIMTKDIIVLGGLAGVLCWTYIILPLVFCHS